MSDFRTVGLEIQQLTVNYKIVVGKLKDDKTSDEWHFQES